MITAAWIIVFGLFAAKADNMIDFCFWLSLAVVVTIFAAL